MRDIQSLIPQRPPILMVEEYVFDDENTCHSLLTIAEDNLFLDENHHMASEGILEHIAQTAAAHIGYRRKLAGSAVNYGYIGDIKRCQITEPMPSAGEQLSTVLHIISQVENITMISAETSVNGRVVVSCRMKLAN
ncbi:MAG: hydroxymyristoyl-ACP dehydratase [Bacteroidales bacterium]|nr:hydroxymyristoyl-ACP dehydratase [Bacteroidales bacterium]